MHITIEREGQTTFIRQIYEQIKNHILAGTLKPNEKLPSTRNLAKELGLSRNVVVEAYDQLLAEGYIESSEGSGTYVTDGAFLELTHSIVQIKRENILGLRHEPIANKIDFRTGVPSLSLFPKETWASLYKKVCQDLPPIQLDYHEPRGSYELRYELTRYLRRVRGVNCKPDQVLIITGAAQAFTMLGRLFNSINKDVLVEDPLSHGIITTLEKNDMHYHPVPIDDKGIMTDKLPSDLRPSLIFTTPSHQYPTGCVLPIKRRIDLINYARKKSAYIIEDDYDSEFRYEGSPIESMQRLDPERVIYVGTFSKILCPAIRMGYMILPEQIIDQVRSIKYTEDIHSPILEQLTLARFIRDGHLDRHIKKAKDFYHKKNQLVRTTLDELFDNQIEITGYSTGIHLIVKFKGIVFDKPLFDRLDANGIHVPSVEEHAIVKGNHLNQIMIGYGNLSNEEIKEGIKRIKDTLNN